MALESFTGTFTAPTTNQTQAISGLGFTPKFVRIIGIDTSNSIVDDYELCIGAASGSGATEQFGFSCVSLDNLGTSDTFKAFDDGVLVNLAASSSTHVCVATLDSFDSDGFTLDWTTTSTAVTFIYMAMGGSSLSVDVGFATFPNSSGNFSTTGVGFEPKAVEIWVQAGLSATSAEIRYTQGAATSSSARNVIYNGSLDNQATSDSFRYQSEDRIAVQMGSGGSLNIDVDFVSNDSDGFTLDNNTPPGSTQELAYIAWGGTINAAAGMFTQATTISTQATTGVGFEPHTTFFKSINNPNADAVQTSATINQGFASSSSIRAYANVYDADNVTTTNTSKSSSTALCISAKTNGGIQSAADFISNDSDGFTLDWQIVDGNARDIYYLSIGDAATGGIIPQIQYYYSRLRNG